MTLMLERLFKVKKNGVFLFGISFLVFIALTINVKAQLMERDAIYIQSLLHCSLLLLNVTQQNCYMLDHCIGPSCLRHKQYLQ